MLLVASSDAKSARHPAAVTALAVLEAQPDPGAPALTGINEALGCAAGSFFTRRYCCRTIRQRQIRNGEGCQPHDSRQIAIRL
jgi:hypothetical protein